MNKSILESDDMFVKTERIVVPVTSKLKKALTILARNKRVTVSQIVRLAVINYAESEYPEFSEIYTKLSRENK